VTRSGHEIDRIAGALLVHLGDALDEPTIGYDLPMTRLLGGFETSIYQFRLRGVPSELDRSLVLRLYPARSNPDQAVWESQVQNVLAEQGHPVARVHLVCTDPSVLGGAFFVMDFVPGALLTTLPPQNMFHILGQAHAALHKSDPEPVVAALVEQGSDADRLALKDRAGVWRSEFPWLCKGIDWLVEHRPPEPTRLAICHGDFHPLNVLVQDDEVTGILDWAELSIADPAWDVANTVLRIRMPYKYFVSGLLGPEFASVDWEQCVQVYLDAYRTQHAVGLTHLEYYLARQGLYSLVEGVRGHVVWRHPPIAQELVDMVYAITGVRIAIPDQKS
jgi:aminoglycoside phosphotransferase (APT) family kinase protein